MAREVSGAMLPYRKSKGKACSRSATWGGRRWRLARMDSASQMWVPGVHAQSGSGSRNRAANPTSPASSRRRPVPGASEAAE